MFGINMPCAVPVQRRIAEVRRESGADSGTSTSGGTLLRKVLSASERDAQGTARADSKGSSTRSAMSEDEIVEQAKRWERRTATAKLLCFSMFLSRWMLHRAPSFGSNAQVQG